MRDAYYQPASGEQVQAFASVKGLAAARAAEVLEKLRARKIQEAKEDPYHFGYEPEIWYVTKALMRNTLPNEQERKYIEKRYNLAWEEFAAKMRSALGFKHPVGEILLMGANRSGKTDFASRLTIETLMQGQKTVYVGSQSLPTSKDVQMPRIWHYMPNEYKAKNVALARNRDVNEQISYTKQNGFSNSKITFGNGSNARFISYEMNPANVFEGQSLNLVWLDEEFLKAFLESARFRLADTRGTMICSFTPVQGWTPVVADYLEGLKVTRWHTAWMLPEDLGRPMPWKELGLDEDEYTKLRAWRNEGAPGDIGIPEARPEKIIERILAERAGDDFDEIPAGRRFERTPRIGVARGGEAAVVWFYGRDNPYGNPAEVIAKAAANKNAAKSIKTRVYGIAERVKGRMLPEFRRERHVVKKEEIPEKLVRIMVLDPAPERNWAFLYMGWDPETKTLYAYREWPGPYEIPGVGYPGPWAVASDWKGGINDGERGEATESFNFGYLNYKFEWARLEGWRNWRDWAEKHGAMAQCKDWEELENWSESDGTEEEIEFRVIDSRAASQSKIHAGSSVSLFEDVSKLAEGFQPASGQAIAEGLNLIRDMLARDRIKISEECVNTIFALETYTGADGQKGAVKDFIDLIRYGVLSGITEYTAATETEKHEVQARAPGRAGVPRRSRIWW